MSLPPAPCEAKDSGGGADRRQSLQFTVPDMYGRQGELAKHLS